MNLLEEVGGAFFRQKIMFSQYHVLERIGEGSFGKVSDTARSTEYIQQQSQAAASQQQPYVRQSFQLFTPWSRPELAQIQHLSRSAYIFVRVKRTWYLVSILRCWGARHDPNLTLFYRLCQVPGYCCAYSRIPATGRDIQYETVPSMSSSCECVLTISRLYEGQWDDL